MMSGSRVIITGVAGTGKSTILSRMYHRMKELQPNHAKVKVALTDDLFRNAADKVDVIEFFLNLIAKRENVGNEFLHSLLKH